MEVLQWLVEEGKVPLVVRDAGGETLVHHAAHHGQVQPSHSGSYGILLQSGYICTWYMYVSC